MSISLNSNEIERVNCDCENWKVHLVDKGLNTMTGGRLKRLASWLGDDTFMLTYGDGLCNVDLHKLLDFHKANGRMVTLTAVHPPRVSADCNSMAMR
jgi:glucose-1-phosphate cytidylyltransferase